MSNNYCILHKVYRHYKRSVKQKISSHTKNTIEADKIKNRVKELNSTQQSLLDFLVSVTDKNNVSILGPDVDWKEVKRQLNSLPSGKRKMLY